MIVYGWNTFKIKTISQYDVHLDIAWNGGHIEVRQKYFHLFWIPFFPIGKMWVFNGPGGQHYLHDSIIAQIRQQGVKVKTPWYSFILLLLIGLGLGIALVGNAIEDSNRKARELARYESEHKEQVESIKAIAPGQVLYFEGEYLEGGNDYRYCKVLNANDTGICVATPHEIRNSPAADLGDIVAMVNDSTTELDTLWINRAKLLAALPANSNETYYTFKLKSPFPNSNRNYKLSEVYSAKGVDLRADVNYCHNEGKEISLNLDNKGLPGKINRIKNSKGNIKWTYDKDKYYTIPVEGLRLSGKSDTKIGDFEFTIETEDDYKNIVSFLVKGNCDDVTVTRLK